MGPSHDEHADFDRKLAALKQRVDQLHQQTCAASTHPDDKPPRRSKPLSPMPEVKLRDLPKPPGLNLLQHIPAGVVRLDPEYRRIWANAPARSCLDTLTPATVGEQILDLGGTPIQELITPRPDGLPHEVVIAGPPRQVFTIQTRALPAADAGGWVLLIQDVTAERHRQQQRAQQERLEAMQQLITGVANAFGTLLSGIIGQAERLQTQITHSQAHQDDLVRIAQWGYRGVRMARYMLDFSGTSVTRLCRCELGLILKKQLIPLLECSLPATIRVVLDTAPGAYWINADVALMRQLLTQLAVNARDAMPDGGVLGVCLLHLTLHPADPRPCLNMPDGEWVVLTVADTGRGMSSQVQERLFDPYFTTQPGTHAGLGLAQVYGIVKQHGGYITVMSQPEQGTFFALYFPSQTDSAGATWASEGEEVPRGRGETLLLVDEDPLRREALRLTLRYLRYRVLTAANNQEAVAMCEEPGTTIRLIVTALAPTTRGGLALVNTLRQQHPKVKVVALLEASDWEACHDMLAQGVTTCLRQPSDLPQLVQAVSQALVACD